MTLVATWGVEKSQNSSIFGVPLEMSSLFWSKYIVTHIFALSVVLPVYYSYAQASKHFFILRKSGTYLPLTAGGMLPKATERYYAECWVLLDLCIFIVVEEREMSCFQCLYATLQLVCCTTVWLLKSCEAVTTWHYAATISVRCTSIRTDYEEVTLVKSLILISSMILVSQLDKFSVRDTFGKWAKSRGPYL